MIWASKASSCNSEHKSASIETPTLLTDDKAAAGSFIAGRRLGEGTAAGPRNYVIDRIGEIVDAGAQEIMIGGLSSDSVENFQRFDEEVIQVFQ